LFTYVAPLAFVIIVTMIKEAYDDIKRWKRDREVNSRMYKRLTKNGLVDIPASEIQVGYIIQIKTNQSVPSDMILLRTTEHAGGSFIRTDQLDGETDWKLRLAVSATQKLDNDSLLFEQEDARIFAEKPRKAIYNFIGTYTYTGEENKVTNFFKKKKKKIKEIKNKKLKKIKKNYKTLNRK
jgi:phospholipid-translocating ATPase